ncbi:hypothetical protein D3C72_2519990 [compost metagenome]
MRKKRNGFLNSEKGSVTAKNSSRSVMADVSHLPKEIGCHSLISMLKLLWLTVRI